MSDTLLFYISIFVFSMMGVGLVLTMLEFRSLGRRDTEARRRHGLPPAREIVRDFLNVGERTEVLQPVPVRSDQR